MAEKRAWRKILRWRVFAVSAAAVAIVVLPCVGGLLFFRYVYCGESSGPYVSSPDLDYYAQVRSLNCFVTSGWETEVVIQAQPSHKIDKVPDGAQVLLGLDIAPESIELEWKSDRHLEVRYPLEIDRYREEVSNWRDITITYVDN